MRKFYELDFNSFIDYVLSTTRYLINDKDIRTPAMPIETGFNLHILQNATGDFLSIEMICRWGILYELFSIIDFENKTKKEFEIKARNSLYFATEWLDDLLLFNWEIDHFDTVNDWEGKSMIPYQNILKYCKHCFKEIDSPFPIHSLHNLTHHSKDCLRKYNDKAFRNDSEEIFTTRAKLRNISREILFLKPVEKTSLVPKVKSLLEETRTTFQRIAKKWFNKLQKQDFYTDIKFSPMANIKKVKLYIPASTTKALGDYKKQLNTVYPDLREIFNKMNEKNLEDPLTISNLTRLYFMCTFVN